MDKVKTDSNNAAKRIKEGKLKRQESLRQLQKLKKEYNEKMQLKRKIKNDNSDLFVYLPNIIIFLVFMSFPLSEAEVDWVLFSLQCLLNLAYSLIVTPPLDGFHGLLLVIYNFCLATSFPLVRESLTHEVKVFSVPLIAFLGLNALFILILYFGYVERRFWFKFDYNATLIPHLQDGFSNIARDEEASALLEFAIKEKKYSRLDEGLTLLLLGDIVILVCVGVIPLAHVLKTLRTILNFF